MQHIDPESIELERLAEDLEVAILAIAKRRLEEHS